MRPRDIPFQDMECVDLLLSLNFDGWQCESVVPKMLPCEAYVHGESAKVWYHQIVILICCFSSQLMSTSSLCHTCNRSLCMTRCLGSQSNLQPEKERPALFFCRTQTCGVDESALLPLPKKHAPRDKRARAAPSQDALLDDFPDLDTVLEHPAIEDAGSEGDAFRCGISKARAQS